MAIYEVYKEGQNIVKTGKIKLRNASLNSGVAQ